MPNKTENINNKNPKKNRYVRVFVDLVDENGKTIEGTEHDAVTKFVRNELPAELVSADELFFLIGDVAYRIGGRVFVKPERDAIHPDLRRELDERGVGIIDLIFLVQRLSDNTTPTRIIPATGMPRNPGFN